MEDTVCEENDKARVKMRTGVKDDVGGVPRDAPECVVRRGSLSSPTCQRLSQKLDLVHLACKDRHNYLEYRNVTLQCVCLHTT